ncbi:uncharacterized protein A1O5_05701 [Cladophialophora psammophila CBS 110553]|uniref:Zn(2)-C6 fungal-type domain-containing protein n=1 Tax=Cladophialophora psammophila CBS 110553 TaxID=1182543 RepID=W9X1A2_9EURO|nr:uncharacterized protein A1O5_05701 [Cladophialophora psammophila CBS 110553]EXJ70711.1 hypothetical protein A1O5_05701 [Cladophialophora psammophila CBS 110553]
MPSDSGPPAPRKQRTRTNVRQSKYGCFTCRARRVKCDESKPRCLRCQRGKRSCEGYPDGAPRDPGPPQTGVVPVEPGHVDRVGVFKPTGLGPNPELDRLRLLACAVLSQGRPGARTEAETAFWGHLVPQLALSIPSVMEAAAAFGASYEQQMLQRNCGAAKFKALKQITAAMAKIRQDVLELPHGPLPVLVACTLLASAETIQYRQTDALLHLRGAFSIMNSREWLSTKSLTGKALLDDDLSCLFGKLDLQVITYALGNAPELQCPVAAPGMDGDVTMFTPRKADRTLFRTLHSCYSFATRAAEYKYLPRAASREVLVLDQSRHIAELNKWLSCYRQYSKMGHGISAVNGLHGLVLQAHCLSALIYVSNILEPFETAYDKYALQFQQLVECVERAMRAKPAEAEMPTFNAEMGIIQPLFFTAIKYRDSTWRLKAISLLEECGREGPWCGCVEAAAAECVVRAEETAASQAAADAALCRKSTPRTVFHPQDIPEQARVAGHSLFDVLEDASGATWATIEMSRCRDMHAMLLDGQPQPDVNEHWSVWRETCRLRIP